MSNTLLFVRVTTKYNEADPFTNKSRMTTEWFNANRNGKTVTVNDPAGSGTTEREFDADSFAKEYAIAQTQQRLVGYIIAEKTYATDPAEDGREQRYVETFQWTRNNGWVLKETKTVSAKAPAEVTEAIASNATSAN